MSIRDNDIAEILCQDQNAMIFRFLLYEFSIKKTYLFISLCSLVNSFIESEGNTKTFLTKILHELKMLRNYRAHEVTIGTRGGVLLFAFPVFLGNILL